MKIYSFEFGSKPVKYELNEFNGKWFFGTKSRNFYPSKSMIKISNEEEFKNIRKGSFCDAVVMTQHPGYAYLNKFSFNIDINIDVNYMPQKNNVPNDDLCGIIVIDNDKYRLVSYTTYNDHYDGTDRDFYIMKTWVGKFTHVSFFSIASDAQPGFVIILVLYNRMTKQYEYFSINKHTYSLECENRTSDVGKGVMKQWEEYDKSHQNREVIIREYIPHPVGKFYITSSKYKDELEDFLLDHCIDKPVIAVVEENTMSISKLIKDTFHGTKLALTWYRTNIIDVHEKDYPIELNFTMDETGIVRG